MFYIINSKGNIVFRSKNRETLEAKLATIVSVGMDPTKGLHITDTKPTPDKNLNVSILSY